MIKFFRHIRQQLLTESKFSKYLIYALGEIALVMIGILLALQVNNWNEGRKQYKQEYILYGNLVENLKADSADVARVRNLLEKGIRANQYLLGNSYQEIVENTSINELRDTILLSRLVANSFFPRNGAYKEITNNGYGAFLHSEEIKTRLAELYDRKYVRYLHIDASIDKKSEFDLEPIIGASLQIFDPDHQIQSSDAFDLERFKTHYPALKRACASILPTSVYAEKALQACQESIDNLLLIIQEELARSNQ